MIGVNGRRSAPATTIIFSSPLLTDRLHWPSPALEKCSASLPDEDTMAMGFCDNSVTITDDSTHYKTIAILGQRLSTETVAIRNPLYKMGQVDRV